MNDKYLLSKTKGQIVLEMAYASIFPNKCMFCRKVLEELREIACGDCEKAAIFAQNIGDDIYAAYDYDEESVRHVVLRFKYEGKRLLARAMAQGIFRRFDKEDMTTVDFVTCVPLHVNRLKERGYNQAALLATELGRLYGLPAYDGMKRIVDTAKQFNLNSEERAANVAGAFAVREGFCVAGKDILLVDDVYTTGVTAAECVRVLLEAEAKSVKLMVFAAVAPYA